MTTWSHSLREAVDKRNLPKALELLKSLSNNYLFAFPFLPFPYPLPSHSFSLILRMRFHGFVPWVFTFAWVYLCNLSCPPATLMSNLYIFFLSFLPYCTCNLLEEHIVNLKDNFKYLMLWGLILHFCLFR